ncbi:hypothetical protein ACKGJO_06790 [Gracilimonas sp. Q87]
MSKLPHYYVNEVLFLDFDDALEYCDEHSLPYEDIEKSYEYK